MGFGNRDRFMSTVWLILSGPDREGEECHGTIFENIPSKILFHKKSSRPGSGIIFAILVGFTGDRWINYRRSGPRTYVSVTAWEVVWHIGPQNYFVSHIPFGTTEDHAEARWPVPARRDVKPDDVGVAQYDPRETRPRGLPSRRSRGARRNGPEGAPRDAAIAALCRRAELGGRLVFFFFL